jgi:hypothetical protein
MKERTFTMVLGMSLAAFTGLHVIISLIGIGTGFIVLLGLFRGKLLVPWNGIFLVATILTSVTGFFFPFTKVTPGIILGVLSLIALVIAVFALYVRHLSGGWRRAYAITAMTAQYFNVFVLIAQLFRKVPALHAIAPTGTEVPFKVSQLILLVLFIYFIAIAAKRFRASPV